MTATRTPPVDTGAPGTPGPGRPPRAAELARIRRGLRRRAGVYRRRVRLAARRAASRAVHAWRSSLQVRIGAITMVVAGTVVIIVSLVLFSQIRDQLLSVKRQAAIDQAQAGVLYAQERDHRRHRHRRRRERAGHAGPDGQRPPAARRRGR